MTCRKHMESNAARTPTLTYGKFHMFFAFCHIWPFPAHYLPVASREMVECIDIYITSLSYCHFVGSLVIYRLFKTIFENITFFARKIPLSVFSLQMSLKSCHWGYCQKEYITHNSIRMFSVVVDLNCCNSSNGTVGLQQLCTLSSIFNWNDDKFMNINLHVIIFLCLQFYFFPSKDQYYLLYVSFCCYFTLLLHATESVMYWVSKYFWDFSLFIF